LGTEDHRHNAPAAVAAAVITVSDSRTPRTDDTGRLIRGRLEAAGHRVLDHSVVKDDAAEIAEALLCALDLSPDLVVVNGGTGISPKDVTIEAVRPLLDKEMPAFSVLFAAASHEQIGPAAILSRAMAGVRGRAVVFCLPGSPRACELALDKLILPEAGHLAAHVRGRT